MALVTVTVLHIPILTFAHVEALCSSQSPLPVPQNKSCTITVIKAQAFGNTRRIRTKTKKSTETATRIAYDVLEARGIDLGNRRRRNDLDASDRH